MAFNKPHLPEFPAFVVRLYIDGWLDHVNCLGQWGARKFNSNRGLLLETACYVPGREGAQHPPMTPIEPLGARELHCLYRTLRNNKLLLS